MHADKMAFPALMCKLKNYSNSVSIEESDDDDDEPDHNSEVSDDFDEDEI